MVKKAKIMAAYKTFILGLHFLIFLNLLILTSNSGVVVIFCFLGVLNNLLIPFVTQRTMWRSLSSTHG